MSPLGRYAEGVAALVSLSIIAVWLTMMLLGHTPPGKLDDAVLIALGYVFVKGGVQAGETLTRTATAQGAATEAARVEGKPPNGP